METVGYDRLLYVDTDSIMFIQNKYDKPLLDTGRYLGELTNEIPDGWEMILFIGLGPKNYAYRIREISTGKVKDVLKIRGITLNYRTKDEITLDHFYDLVTEKTQKKVIFSPNNIRRKPGFVIVSRPETKTHQVTKSKRRRIIENVTITDYKTLPYGYRQV